MARHRRWLPWIVVASLLAYGAVRRGIATKGDIAWTPPAAPENHLRIATWNLENFPRPEQDRAWLRHELEALDPDVVALQEVRDPSALRRLLPQREIRVTSAGGRGGQRLAIAWDPARLRLVEPIREDDRLSMGGRVRPALVARLEPIPAGARFHLVVVHLKATPAGYALRRRQWSRLQALLAELPPREVVFVVGDFNTTEISEPQRLAASLAPARLQLLPLVGECTAYWQGVRHDGWLEPSQLDLIFASRHVGSPRREAGGACARHACAPLQSTDAYPDRDVDRASDHCPVWVDVPL